MDSLCNLCFVFVFAILSCLFLAALWSLAGNGADLFALLWVMYSCFLSLAHMVSSVACVF